MQQIPFYFLETAFSAILKISHEEDRVLYRIHFLDDEVKDIIGDKFEFVFENNNLIALTARTASNQRLLDYFYDQIMLYRIQHDKKPANTLKRVK